MSRQDIYPVTVRGELTEPPSNALWLIKWLLAIPHYIILAFLWIAFIIVSIIAFFAILFTGKYPEDIFKFVIGMNRWSYRVYAYVALMTDEYPPFRLQD